MQVRHRFVKFGTQFQATAALRGTQCDRSTLGEPLEPEQLCENELAVDVGGTCWGYGDQQKEQKRVLDHHFNRGEDNFPSAAAAVLHFAGKIASHFGRVAQRSECAWIVTHGQADFDALCAAYLARCVILASSINADAVSSFEFIGLGLHPEGWIDLDPDTEANRTDRSISRFDWYRPPVKFLPSDLRWMFLLASVASHSDNCRPLLCSRQRSLPAILYASMHRGQNYETESGATEFFHAVETRITEQGLNPLCDSVLERRTAYEPELLLLDRAEDAYRRDLTRARRAVVNIPVATDFLVFFDDVKSRPLLERAAPGLPPRTACVHVDMDSHGQLCRQVDGIYIRDPECILFRDYARADREHSRHGEGFLFTAVAYSGLKSSPHNTTDYYFALDPERAQGGHLYPLWARLQTAEIAALLSDEGGACRTKLELKEAICRRHFEGRAGEHAALFADPWFDGQNYRATIIATPAAGSLIGPEGVQPSLEDDQVATIVRDCLESVIYAGPGKGLDFPASAVTSDSVQPFDFDPANRSCLAKAGPLHCFRFGSVQLRNDVSLLEGGIAEQIGRSLWRTLNPESPETVPSDFRERHLVIERSMVAVWSRLGIVVAHHSSAQERVHAIRDHVREMAKLSASVEQFLPSTSKKTSLPNPSALDPIMRVVAKLQWDLAQPDGRLLHRFFEAIGFQQVFTLAHNLSSAAAALQTQRASESNLTTIAHVQRNAEWMEIFIIGIYATELAHIISGEFHNFKWAVIYFAAASIVTGVFAFCVIRPDRVDRHDSKSPLGRMVVLAVWFLILFVWGAFIRKHESAPSASESNGKTEILLSQPPSGSTSDKKK
jgi:hypothetical protein